MNTTTKTEEPKYCRCGSGSEHQYGCPLCDEQDKEIDHESTDEAVCPHCGRELTDSWELPDEVDEQECECGKSFSISRYTTCTYTTYKK